MDVNQLFETIQQLQSTVASLQNSNGNRQNQQQTNSYTNFRVHPTNDAQMFAGAALRLPSNTIALQQSNPDSQSEQLRMTPNITLGSNSNYQAHPTNVQPTNAESIAGPSSAFPNPIASSVFVPQPGTSFRSLNIPMRRAENVGQPQNTNRSFSSRASAGGLARSLQLQQQQIQQLQSPEHFQRQRTERAAVFARTPRAPYDRTPPQPVYVSKIIQPIAYGGIAIKPDSTELDHYPFNGLEAKTINFMANGTQGYVLQTILSEYPAMVKEGRNFIMMKAQKNSKTLVPFVEGNIISVAAMRGFHGKLYFAPLEEGDDVVIYMAPSGVTINCNVCKNQFDETEIASHACIREVPDEGEVVQLELLPVELTVEEVDLEGDDDAIQAEEIIKRRDLLRLWRENVRANYPDEEEETTLTVKRGFEMESLMGLYLEQQHKTVLNRKVTVKYVGEEGVDGGGLTNDLASSIINMMSTVLPSGPQTSNDEDIIEWQNICRCGGFFLGTFMKKTIFFPSLVLKYGFQSPNPHFVNGLSESGVQQILLGNSILLQLLVNPKVSAKQIYGMIKHVEHRFAPLKAIQRLEELNMGYMRRLLKEIQDGHIPNLTLTTFYKFLTGGDHPPPNGIFARFSTFFSVTGEKIFPESGTCAGSLTIPITETYEEMREMWILALRPENDFFGRI